MPKSDLNLYPINEDEGDQKNDINRKQSEKQIPRSKLGKNRIVPRMVESIL